MSSEQDRGGDGTVDESRPAEILAWASARFGSRVVLVTGFGPEGCVLIHLIARSRLPIPVLTLDTGLLFPETEALGRRLQERYGVAIRAVRPLQTVEEQASTHGERLWEIDGEACCGLRKIAPLRGALQGMDAWITGVRRDQTQERAEARGVEDDRRFGIVKINPLVAWTERDVWDYVRAHEIPVNPLHEQGYRSIGCMPCTTPVGPGEDERAGRWRGQSRRECGLHTRLAQPEPEFSFKRRT